MRNHFKFLILCLGIIACKKDIPREHVVPEKAPKQEIPIIEIDSTAILDSIAKVDSIAKITAIEKAKLTTKKKRKKKEVKPVSKSESPYKSLIFNVQLGITPKRKNWVLFENGTYVIFPDGYTKDQMKNAAIKLVKSFNNNPITVQKSNFAKGWIISTAKGIYNYVGRDQIKKGITSNDVIQKRGKQNISKDKRKATVVHINTN